MSVALGTTSSTTARRNGAAVTVGLLGEFRVAASGVGMELPSSAERVVAFVALEGQPVRRARVACQLWLDSTDERSAASLRSALWRLRKTDDALIQATPNDLRLAPGVRVDALDAVALARSLVAGEAPAAAGDAVDVLSRELLPAWYDDEWLLLWRERWRQLRLHALESLAASLARAGRTAEAVDAALAAVRGEPLRESARRRLVEIHLVEGNRGEALREYEAFRTLLDDELGVAPSEPCAALLGRD
jgi:DNA-binding SARP family transcriptional activator